MGLLVDREIGVLAALRAAGRCICRYYWCFLGFLLWDEGSVLGFDWFRIDYLN